ncbi:MAG: HAD family hydrolase [Actinomycetota bacterium]
MTNAAERPDGSNNRSRDRDSAGRPLGEPDLLIFDCDGVLVDSEIIAVEVESRLLTEAGFPMTVDEVATTCVGLSYPDMVRVLEERFGRPVPDSLNLRLQQATLAEFPDRLRPVPGIADLLAGSSIERCVASSSDPDRIALSLDITGLASRFPIERVFSATMVQRGKPAPDLFLHAARRTGHRPDRCLVIEDSPHGVEAAVAAGMAVIGFVGGGHARPALTDRLLAAGANRVVDHHDAVAELIGG